MFLLLICCRYLQEDSIHRRVVQVTDFILIIIKIVFTCIYLIIIYFRVEVIGYKDVPPPLDHTHPDWHDRALMSYKDHNVLLEGLNQAKIVTNSIEIETNLPEKIKISELPKDVDKISKYIIFNSHLFDAEQKKLPIIKDPSRPAWNFPRTYGITQDRRK